MYTGKTNFLDSMIPQILRSREESVGSWHFDRRHSRFQSANGVDDELQLELSFGGGHMSDCETSQRTEARLWCWSAARWPRTALTDHWLDRWTQRRDRCSSPRRPARHRRHGTRPIGVWMVSMNWLIYCLSINVRNVARNTINFD